MAVICSTKVPCEKAKCIHYRYDEDKEHMNCFVLEDFKTLGIHFDPKINEIPSKEIISIHNIDWDIDDCEKEVELPVSVQFELKELNDLYGINEDSIGNYLADKYGFCVNSYNALLKEI